MPKHEENALVIEQKELARQTYRLRLQSPRIAAEARPGQFVMLRVRDGPDPLLRRPLSFHRIYSNEGIIEVLYRVVGHGTWLLSRSLPGDRVNLIGPLGNGFKLPETAIHTVVVVAGGIGIAPVFELLAQLTSDRFPQNVRSLQSVHLFYGARTAAEMLSPDAFDDMGISIHWCTDDGTLGYGGYVTQLLQQTVEREGMESSILYACGPLAMQFHVARWALARNIPSQLSLESLMACGFGACLGCALPARHPVDSSADHFVHVCKDGPVFEAGSIQWHKIQMQQPSPPIFLFS